MYPFHYLSEGGEDSCVVLLQNITGMGFFFFPADVYYLSTLVSFSLSLLRLGLLSECAVECCGNVVETLCARLQQLLVYKEGEKDAIYLNHFIGIRWPDNKVMGTCTDTVERK